mmetsp:Transcript_102400/g.289589  ORF Transcript_102400/g.289589 Transcript_102400/m.289589 type:complete len:241 (-) Transcript_102400:214-936(-)
MSAWPCAAMCNTQSALQVKGIEEGFAFVDPFPMILGPNISLRALLQIFGTPVNVTEVLAIGALEKLAPDGSPTSARLEQAQLLAQIHPSIDLPALPSEVTALVVRNISPKYTTQALFEEWVPDGTFNFLHIPHDHVNHRMSGYAFINFVTHAHAVAFQQKWHKQKLRFACKSRKPLHVLAAPVQGYHANLMYAKSRHLDVPMRPATMPALFFGTRRLDAQVELSRLPEPKPRARARRAMP